MSIKHSTDNAALGVGDAARSLGISKTYTRYLADTGRLPSTRDATGRRLFSPAGLRAFTRARRRRQRALSRIYTAAA